ncbi:hypothetical protein EUGRSUZ_I02127 [Eucalyptus grandis]|uniref:Uncharacterized protein n=2 Tax=Eucalyptus grandis TaxID=71139 RepID=A0ACC3JH47_EUCGR|nr:hypothetical protein EUGRSUZ_I02127 [Eucalyptus grandis]
MRKAFLLACALLISFALLFLPSTEARVLLQKGPLDPTGPACGRQPGGRYRPCTVKPPPPTCGRYVRQCHPPVIPRGP